MEAKTYQSLMLGNSLETILDQEKKLYPRVTEYVFTRAVLPTLTRFFMPDFFDSYIKFVGEPTKPLVVVNDTNHDSVILTVPPVWLSVNTTVSKPGSPTIDNMVVALQRALDQRGVDSQSQRVDMLMQSVRQPDYIEYVIKPISQILANYNMRFELPAGVASEVVDSALATLPDNGVPDTGYEYAD